MSELKKEQRRNFRDSVLFRDGYACVFCRETEDLDIHHITDRNEMPDGGYVKENGITLCSDHHKMAEVFHQTNGKDWPEGFHPDDLYKKIGSTLSTAI